MRGIKVIQQKAAALDTDKTSTLIPCYIGQAPIWQVDDVNWQNLAGQTFLINNTDEMKEKVGFIKPDTGAWSKEASLCCAAVYNLDVMLTAPIAILVNKQTIPVGEEETKSLTFTEGQAIILSDSVVLSSFSITGKTKGTDYTVAYDGAGQKVTVKALTEMTEVDAKYKSVNTSSLTFSPDTFEEFDFFEQTIGIVPAVFGCPLWEDDVMEGSSKTVGEKLMEVIQEPLNLHWFTQGYVNLSGDTITEAKTAKGSYKNYKMKACWPWFSKTNRIYPLSVAYMAIKEMVDKNANGVPYISASNEAIDMDFLCTADGSRIRLKESDSTGMNDVGIATANFSDMQWVTWGVCMSNYNEEHKDEIDADKLNDISVQMKDYVSNLFQQTYAKQLDKPMPKRAANDIVVGFQGALDALVTIGALVYANVEFLSSENSTANLADGVFTFSIAETNTPPGKAIVGKVAYNADALASYYADGGTE